MPVLLTIMEEKEKVGIFSIICLSHVLVLTVYIFQDHFIKTSTQPNIRIGIIKRANVSVSIDILHH